MQLRCNRLKYYYDVEACERLSGLSTNAQPQAAQQSTAHRSGVGGAAARSSQTDTLLHSTHYDRQSVQRRLGR
eukprot:5569-Heterococcus_DN1.PRE.1